MQASDGDVLTNSQWNGISGNGEIHTQGSGCQELHVSYIMACPSSASVLPSLPIMWAYIALDSYISFVYNNSHVSNYMKLSSLIVKEPACSYASLAYRILITWLVRAPVSLLPHNKSTFDLGQVKSKQNYCVGGRD